MNKTVKSICAVIAGVVVGAVLSLLTDYLLEVIGVLPSVAEQKANGLWVPSLLIILIAYRCIYTVLSGYVTATLAPSKPKKHLVVLGILAVVANAFGLIVCIALDLNLGPAWYPLVLTLTAFPCVWLGGWLQWR